MTRRLYSSSLLPALTTLAVLTAVSDARATPPNCENDLPPPDVTRWPLWERPQNPQSIPADVGAVNPALEPRTHIWNSFGEFQTWSDGPQTHYLHSGIDINGVGLGFSGDWVAAVASGYIWAVHSFTSDACTDQSRCKLYVRSPDHRYIYYYAHLKVRSSGTMQTGVEFDSSMRERLIIAASFDDADEVDKDDPFDPNEPTYADTQVTAGEVLTSLATFSSPKFAHLHFAILDACENHDGISPLDFLSLPDGYVDDTPPVIEDLQLVRASDGTSIAHCAEVTSADDFDIVVTARDIWRPEPLCEFGGNLHLGIDRATYRLTNLSTLEDPDPVEWYDFAQIPFTCAGPDVGTACADPLTEAELVSELGINFPPVHADATAGPWIAWPFAEVLFDPASESWDHHPQFPQPVEYMSILNNEWGIDDGPIDTTALDPGVYQVVAEVFDQRGLSTSASRFFMVPGPGVSMSNLLIRDSEHDDGSIPSNAGGKKTHRSPNIKVGGSEPDWDDPIWSTVQTINVPVGVPTKVWIRVENVGCEDITGIEVKAGTTKAAMISTNWVEIGTVSEPTLTIPAGEARVVGLDWTPTNDQGGHVCMLAAVNSDDDPTKVPLTAGEMDFTLLDQPTAEVVPFDNNLGQRNLTVSSTSANFEFGNPFGQAVDLGVEFDCNDFPINVPGASVVLKFDQSGDLEFGWSDVDRVTTTGGSTSPYTSVSFEGCKITLPPVTLPANTVLDAWVEVNLPVAYTGTWDLDLTAIVDGVPRDGIGIRHTQ